MNIYIIYKLIFPNNKIYIGQTIDYNRRMRQYKSNSYNKKHKYYNSLVLKSIRKYDWNNIKKEIICTVSEEFVDDAEQYFIKQYNSLVENGFGYNIEDGGKLNKITVWKGKKRPDQSKRMMGKGNPNYNKKFSIEHRKNISKSLKGKISPMKGKKISDDIRNRISNTLKGYKHSDISKLNMAISHYKPVLQIEKISNRIIKKYDNISIAGEKTNTNITSISKNLHGKLKSAGGFVWRYAC